MAKHKPQWHPESYESLDKTQKRTIGVNITMFFSPAFQSLTARQQRLYMCMLSTRYNRPRSEEEYISELFGREHRYEYILFSEARWFKGSTSRPILSEHRDRPYYRYELYSDKRAFYMDRDTLIERGFIERAVDGKANMMKNIYKLADKWKRMDASTPP